MVMKEIQEMILIKEKFREAANDFSRGVHGDYDEPQPLFEEKPRVINVYVLSEHQTGVFMQEDRMRKTQEKGGELQYGKTRQYGSGDEEKLV